MPHAVTPVASRSASVTTMGWVSFALGVMGVASGVLQAILLAAMPPLRTLFGAALGPDGMAMPSALAWMFDHMQALNAVSLLLSAAFARVSWDLVQRRERGRRGFIGFLALGALLGFAGVAWYLRLLDDMRAGMAGLGSDDPLAAGMQSALRAMAWLAAGLIAGLHAGIAWWLCRPAVRAEFR